MANYVTFEQAKYLNCLGFNEECTAGYTLKTVGKYYWQIEGGLIIYNDHLNETCSPDHNVEKEFIISAPEQYQVIEWLIIHHSIWVLIDIVDINDACNYVIKWRNNLCLNENRGSGYKTQREAYSAAFDYIKNNNLIIV